MSMFINFSAPVKSAFENDETKFEGFKELMLDYARGTQSVEKAKANKMIVEKFNAALGLKENAAAAEVRRAIRRNQSVVFDLIEETVENLIVTDWQNDPFMMKYVDQKNLAVGDKNDFYVPDDSILSVMKVAGNHHDIIRQRLGAGTHYSVATAWVAIKVYAEAERLLTGAEDFATFITKVYEAYDRYIKNTVYDAMVGYKSTIDTKFKKTGTLTAANLRALCELIETATNEPALVMGTRSAIAGVTSLQNASYISDTMKDEFNRTGLLGMWEGHELVMIPQVFEKNKVGTYKIDNNLLFVMPQNPDKFIKFVNEGDTQLRQVADRDTNMDETYEYEMQAKIGCAVVFNKAFGIYDTTSGT